MIMTNTTKAVYFDMDGTVADLYNREGWLYQLENELPVFEDLAPMVDMDKLAEVCGKLMAQGWKVGVITWLPMMASESYEEESSKEKKAWLDRHMPYVQEVHCLPYGTPKQRGPRVHSDRMVLVDDNEAVRQMWEIGYKRQTIDAKGNIIQELEKLLA